MPKTINEWNKEFEERVKNGMSSDACFIISLKNACEKLYSQQEVDDMLRLLQSAINPTTKEALDALKKELKLQFKTGVDYDNGAIEYYIDSVFDKFNGLDGDSRLSSNERSEQNVESEGSIPSKPNKLIGVD